MIAHIVPADFPSLVAALEVWFLVIPLVDSDAEDLAYVLCIQDCDELFRSSISV
jgi:hypothetical protein